MKLQDQVCTIEQGRKLRDFGIMQPAYFWHVQHHSKKWEVVNVSEMAPGHGGVYVVKTHDSYLIQDACPAFTVAELGIMLLDYTSTWSSCVRIGATVAGYFAHIETNGEPYGAWFNEAEGRADLLITLLEDGRITAEEVNQRLAATT